jgi:hypothetical protein
VIGVSAKLSEAEVHWRDFLASLRADCLISGEMRRSNHEERPLNRI